MKTENATYESPCMEFIEMHVEQCILAASYGNAGDPGQGSGFIDFDDEL